MNKNFGDAKAPPYSSLNTGREVPCMLLTDRISEIS